jgi:hypothetical protein
MKCKAAEKGWGWTVGGWRCKVHGRNAGAAGDQGAMGWCSAGCREVQIKGEAVQWDVETK